MEIEFSDKLLEDKREPVASSEPRLNLDRQSMRPIVSFGSLSNNLDCNIFRQTESTQYFNARVISCIAYGFEHDQPG